MIKKLFHGQYFHNNNEDPSRCFYIHFGYNHLHYILLSSLKLFLRL